jgi:hypothetical protein
MVIDIDEMLVPTQITHTATNRPEAVVPIDRENGRSSMSVVTEGARSTACQAKETNWAAEKRHAAIASFFVGGCI